MLEAKAEDLGDNFSKLKSVNFRYFLSARNRKNSGVFKKEKRSLRSYPQIFLEVFGILQKKKKKKSCHDHGPFLTNRKKELFSS